MLEHNWSGGYVVDIDYTHGYYRELSPSLLRFAALLGSRAVDAEAPFTYYELGCGQGFSTVLHAAANPAGRFFGVDFNPSHIQNAELLAREAGAGNVRFLERSFGELLEGEAEEADFIVLHGVWSWIGAEHRQQVLEFMRRRLKPGGIAYVSYNCLPGVAQVAPLQRLLNEHAGLGAGERMEKVRRAMAFAGQLRDAGARFFTDSPLAVARLADMGRHDPNYLAHEYFNANWTPFFHADVARDLSGAKLAYAASAALMDNFEPLVVKPEVAKLMAALGDSLMAETVKDFARNQAFRRDVFARGAGHAGPAELEAALGRTRFALARPRNRCRLRGAALSGEVTLDEAIHAPLLDALGRSPMSFAELARSPEAGKLGSARLRQAVFTAAAFGNVQPALPASGEEARRSSTERCSRGR